MKQYNPGVIVKKLKSKVNRMNKGFKTGKFKDIFKRLTGAIFSQVSKGGKFAQTNFNEGVKRHGSKSVDDILVELLQLDNMDALYPS